MTMKPEYNYGHQKTHTVHIYNSPSLSGFLRKIIFWMFFRKWDDRLNTSQSFEQINQERLEDMKPELEKVHSYRVCENHYYIVFRNDILIADFPNRGRSFKPDVTPEQQEQHYLHLAQSFKVDVTPEQRDQNYLHLAQFYNGWYSQELTKVNEYSFELWAKNEKVDEAYRFTILPSFHSALVIRLWIKDDVAKLIYKIGGGQADCQNQLKHQTEKRLRYEKWQQTQKFMEQNFWTAETWYSVPANMMVLDGARYLFEGWQNGEYKLLDDHSPDDEYVSARAMKLFMSLTHRNWLNFNFFRNGFFV